MISFTEKAATKVLSIMDEQKVNDEKNANITIVKFETSTSPSWKDIKIFIKNFF